MKYSHNYSKFNTDSYTTIRRYKKGRKVGKVEHETLNDKTLHYSKIVKIESKPLNDIEFQLLLDDTAPFAKNREEIFELFQSFYKKPINFHKENFFIFYLRKLPEI